MPEKSLLEQIDTMHIWLAALTAMWGGLVSYLRQVQLGRTHSWGSVAMHMAMSGFAGLLCWLGCLHFEVPAPLTAICTGLAGHMGAEFVKIVELQFRKKLGNGPCLVTGEAPPDHCETPGPQCTKITVPLGCPKL